MNRNLIVVVDDDSSVRRVLKMQLEEAGYDVALAADGEEARKPSSTRRVPNWSSLTCVCRAQMAWICSAILEKDCRRRP